MSQLLTPGSRMTSFGVFPASPFAGRTNFDVSNHRSIDRSLLDSVGSPVLTARPPSPPPVMSALSVSVYEIVAGVPLVNAVIPDSIHSLRIAPNTALSHSLVAFGRSHV